MSKKEKLLQKAKENPHKIRFSELEALLKQHGFEQIPTNAGSHFKWRNYERDIMYSAPRKNPVKVIYIKRLLSLLETYFS